MIRIGIMQGRLLPPYMGRFQAFPAEDWIEEFRLGSQVGIHCIEWIYEEPLAEANPLSSAAGIRSIKQAIHDHGVLVRSICADYFMTRPLLRDKDSSSKLSWLIEQAAELGAEYIVLPFVDASSLSEDDRQRLPEVLHNPLSIAGRSSIGLHLETDLPPSALKQVLDDIPSKMLRITYDIGNSASLGYNPKEEFDAIGTRLGSVHIKDRVLSGGTVPLGTGNADLPLCLRLIDLAGAPDFMILQAARGISGEEENWIRHMISLVESLHALSLEQR